MTPANQRQIHFAGSALQLHFSGNVPTRIVDFLYCHLPADGPTTPHRTYRLQTHGTELAAHSAGRLLYRGPSAAELADRLLADSSFHLADRSSGGLLFHAGVVALNGRGALLPGTMGAGKTTLTAWLISQNFDYLSDEMGYLPAGSATVHGLSRPLSIKRPSRPVLQPWLNFSEPSPHVLTAAQVDLVQPALLRSNNRFDPASLTLILFPRYRAGSSLDLRPLSKAQTGKALMECLINARNLPGHGFALITRLARQVPAFQLTYSHFRQLENSIPALFEPRA